jgi:hypothetical protein
MLIDKSRRVAGRVHALVRLRPALARLPQPASPELAFNPRHAFRYDLPRGRASHHGRSRFHQAAAPPATPAHSISRSSDRISNLTPRITRRPASLKEFNKLRVGGRVHALVGRRPKPERRGARNRHNSQAAPTTKGLNHARLATGNCFLS